MSSPISAPPERPRRRLASVPRFSKDPEVRSVQVGVVATLLFHFLLFFLMAMRLRPDLTSLGHFAHKKPPETFDINLAPEPDKSKLNNFVETNPDAPENVPDKTNNFGAQNQQAAQEKPAKDQHNDRPAIQGEKDVQSTQIVDGHLSKPNPPQQAAPPTPPPQPVEPAAAAKREQSPLAGKTTQDLEREQAEILVLLTGVDETYEQTVHARTSYRGDEIIWNARFRSVFSGESPSHLLSVDVSRLNDIESV